MNGQQALFRELCDNSFNLMQRVSPQGQFLYVNRAWMETLGYGPPDLRKLRLSDIIHPESRSYVEDLYRRLLAGGNAVQLAAKLQDKEGREIMVEGFVNCQSQRGRPIATYGIFRDLSKIVQAEQGIDRLFNLSLDLLCIAGVDGFFKRINPAFVRVLGYSEGELLAKSFLEFVHPDDRQGTLGAIERLAQGLPVVDFQNRYRAQDGSYRWLSWRSAPWAERGLIYAVARDITEEKRTQELMARQTEELARTNADLQQFANVASHDLSAPLRAVANLAEWIVEDMPGELPEPVSRHIDRLRSTVHRMERLTNDILRYYRAGRDPSNIEVVDTDALLKDLITLLSPPDSFTVSWEPGLPVFETARAPLEQVLRNLIANAIQHHDRQNGRVTISVRERDSSYEFSVSDDGPGIPAEEHGQIFAMFQKGRSGSRIESSGIGLALVNKIVESYGGTVSVQSAEGRGAAFRFTWPKRISTSTGE